MQFTISLLPATLSLVHIPRSRISQLSHPILKQILHPDPIFFNITCNDLELSIFADESILDDFEPISRKDRRRQRSRSNSTSTKISSKIHELDPVEISYEKWSVLQVDSHSNQLDNSGARVNEVSAPLAAAGISILYQSSYMSDFIFVKKSRLAEAMRLLAGAGFDIYSGNSASPLSLTHPHPFPTSELHPPTLPDTYLTRPRSATDPTSTTVPSHLSRTNVNIQNVQKSHSPTLTEVRLLPSDLACVGLSDDPGVDHWALKIIKLVAFPELIASSTFPRSALPVATTPYTEKPSSLLFDLLPNARLHSSSPTSSSSSLLSEDADDGYFSHSPPAESYSPKLTSASRCHSDTLQSQPVIRSRQKAHTGQTDRRTTSNSSLPLTLDSVSRVPFLSYTRTSEGSSLTADVYVLSTLFPASERHMVNSSGELEHADQRLIGAERLGHNPEDEAFPILSCLQIDLQRFGLDKHGLVNRFSQVLRENGINHMYSSTFKTANILVDKRHASRTRSLLCNC